MEKTESEILIGEVLDLDCLLSCDCSITVASLEITPEAGFQLEKVYQIQEDLHIGQIVLSFLDKKES